MSEFHFAKWTTTGSGAPAARERLRSLSLNAQRLFALRCIVIAMDEFKNSGRQHPDLVLQELMDESTAALIKLCESDMNPDQQLAAVKAVRTQSRRLRINLNRTEEPVAGWSYLSNALSAVIETWFDEHPFADIFDAVGKAYQAVVAADFKAASNLGLLRTTDDLLTWEWRNPLCQQRVDRQLDALDRQMAM